MHAYPDQRLVFFALPDSSQGGGLSRMMSKMRLGEAVVKLKPPSELSKMMNSMRLGDEENSTPQLDFQSSSSSDNDDDEDEDDLVCDETYCVPEGHS
jgi:hypothetical protein